MLKKHVAPNVRSAENNILGLFHWTKFSLKFVAIQKSLDFFCDPPISHEKIL